MISAPLQWPFLHYLMCNEVGFTYISSLEPPNDPKKKPWLACTFCRWVNCGRDKVNALFRVTQLGGDRARNPTNSVGSTVLCVVPFHDAILFTTGSVLSTGASCGSKTKFCHWPTTQSLTSCSTPVSQFHSLWKQIIMAPAIYKISNYLGQRLIQRAPLQHYPALLSCS